MENLTNPEQVAQAQGYPATLFGFTPNDGPYWREPGMPWVLPLLNPQHFGLDPVACQTELHGLMAFDLWNENMAPRFPRGTYLAGKPLPWGSEEVEPGHLLAWLAPGEAWDCFDLARVVEIHATYLLLAYDNGGHTLRLPWQHAYPTPRAYRITHYVTQPAEQG